MTVARLVVESGPDEGMIFPLHESVTTLGRSPSNAIQVSDRRASRFHAEIVRRGTTFRLRDLASKNGTCVQGARVAEEHTLRHGDTVRIGQTMFVFEDEEFDAAGTGKSSSSGIRLADRTPAKTRGSVPAGVTHHYEATADQSRLPDAKSTHRRLEVLLRVLQKVRAVLDLDQLLTEIMDLIFEVLKPERGLIMLLDAKSSALTPRCVKTTGEHEEITISRTIVHQAIRERMALLISDAAADTRFHASESIVASRIRTAICAPLTAHDKVLGVLYIDSRGLNADYTQEDLELLTGIADQAALAIANALLHESLVQQHRLERELEIARTIQMNLLPKHPPIVSGFDIAAMTIPAKRVGGDYYDFIEIDSDHLGVAVADVSGKGVPAAIFTASVRAALQTEARRKEARLEAIFTSLNEMACRDSSDNMFVALFYGVLQLSSRRFRYVNAGHCYPYLIDANGGESRLETGGCVLGIIPDRRFEQGEVRLAPRSTLVIYSDGVTDILNERGEAFGWNQFRQLILENPNTTAEVLRQKIYSATTTHKGNADQFDDYTLAIIKAL
jgi:serine phosphatase RsbU (regulator of sigma subunit)